MSVRKKKIYDFSRETSLVRSSSCSIVQTPTGYVMNIGMSNKVQPQRQLTLNKKLVLDSEFNVLSEDVLEQDVDGRRIAGVSDIRLRPDGTFHGHGLHPNGLVCVVHGQYESPLKVDYLTPKDFTSWAKDWVFVEFADGYHVVEKWFPLTIGTYGEDRTLVTKFQMDMPGFEGVRGATNGFFHNDEIYFVVRKDDKHRIVVFSASMDEVRRQTEWFTFEGKTEESAFGLIVTDRDLLVSYNDGKVGVLDIYDQVVLNK